MLTKELTIVNKLGLHARPAALFVKLASKFQCEVWVEKDDEQINGKSIMGLMMLAVKCGSSIIVITDGPDEVEAMAAVEELVGKGFPGS